MGLGALATFGILSSGSGVNAGVDGPVPVPSPVPVPTGRGEGRRAFDPNRTIEPIDTLSKEVSILTGLLAGTIALTAIPFEGPAGELTLGTAFLARLKALLKSAPKVAPQTARLRADQAFMKSGSDAMRGGANTPGLGSSGQKGKELLDSLVGSPPGNAAAQQAATAKGMTINPSRMLGAVDKFVKPTTKMPPNPTPKVNPVPEPQFRSLLPVLGGLFTLPTVKSTPPPGPAPVANESVSINPTNTNNPYMMITPEIYGMYAF